MQRWLHMLKIINWPPPRKLQAQEKCNRQEVDTNYYICAFNKWAKWTWQICVCVKQLAPSEKKGPSVTVNVPLFSFDKLQ